MRDDFVVNRRRFEPPRLFRDGSSGLALTIHPDGCWQDSDMTTPAGIGDPVGFVLDTSQGRGARQVYGSELVTNGGLDTDSDWTKGTGITIEDGEAVFSSVATGGNLRQSFVGDGWYQVTFDITSRTSGGVRFYGPNGAAGTERNGVGTFSEVIYINGSGVIDWRSRSGPSTLTIDNISAREVSTVVSGPELVTNGGFDADSDWTKGDGWSISSGVASCDGTQASTSYLYQDVASVAGQVNQITLDVSAVSGLVRVAVGNAGAWHSLTVGANTFTSPQSGASRIYVEANVGATVSIDNVSVKEIPGNHAMQTTNDDYRPTLGRHPASGVRNLLTYSEDFANAAWAKILGVTAEGPLELSFPCVANAERFDQVTAVTAANAGDVIFSIILSGSGQLRISMVATGQSFESSPITLTETPTRHTISGTFTGAASGQITARLIWRTSDTVISSSVTVGEAQLELGATATTYQKVVDEYDITEDGSADVYYLAFDGVDDYLEVSSLDLSGTDAVSLFAGVHKASDAATGVVCEYSANFAANNGTFVLRAPNSAASDNYRWTGRYDTTQVVMPSGYAAPATNVLTGLGDISDDSLTLRIDGAEAGTANGDQGNGNFGDHTLYVGSRVGSSHQFSGRIYGLTVLGRTATDAEIAKTETFLARKSGVTL